MSDDTVKYSSTPTFNGLGWAVDAVNGCVNSGNCDPGVPHNYYMTPATNPLQGLDNASFSTTGAVRLNTVCGGSVSICSLPSGAYTGNLSVGESGGNNDLIFSPGGTYVFSDANINITGGFVCIGTGTDCTTNTTGCNVTGTACGVNIVLLGNSSLSIDGGTVNLYANTNNILI
jgi:hypothetical protein